MPNNDSSTFPQIFPNHFDITYFSFFALNSLELDRSITSHSRSEFTWISARSDSTYAFGFFPCVPLFAEDSLQNCFKAASSCCGMEWVASWVGSQPLFNRGRASRFGTSMNAVQTISIVLTPLKELRSKSRWSTTDLSTCHVKLVSKSPHCSSLTYFCSLALWGPTKSKLGASSLSQRGTRKDLKMRQLGHNVLSNIFAPRSSPQVEHTKWIWRSSMA